MNKKSAAERLIRHGVKPSVQRIAIMEYLLTHRTHPTADEVYTALSPSIPTLSKTTVYNTMKLFVENRAALMLTIDDKTTRFDGDTSLHAHFICQQCGTVHDLPFVGRKRIRSFDLDGHLVEEVHQYYRGICRHCRASEVQAG